LKGESALKEREQLLREAFDGFMSSVGYGGAWTGKTVKALCELLACQGRYDEVVEIHQTIWDVCRKEKGIHDFHKLLKLRNLANALVNRGRFEEGEKKYQEWIGVLLEKYGEEHPDTLNALVFAGNSLFHAGKKKEAREFMTRAIKGRRQIASTGEASASDLNVFAKLLLTCKLEDLQNPKEALAVLEGADESRVGGDLQVLDTMAMAYSMSGNLDRALEIQQSIAATAEMRNRPFNRNLLRYFARSGDTASLLCLLEEMEAPELERHSDSLFNRAIRLNSYAILLVEEGQYALAEPIARECLDYWHDSPLGILGNTAQIMKSVLGRCLAGMGRYEEAETLLKEGFEGLKNNPVIPLEQQQESLERLIQYYEGMGKYKEASMWRQQRPDIGLPPSE
jgi:tetratricopeptide (TPR) repeat protein